MEALQSVLGQRSHLLLAHQRLAQDPALKDKLNSIIIKMYFIVFNENIKFEIK